MLIASKWSSLVSNLLRYQLRTNLFDRLPNFKYTPLLTSDNYWHVVYNPNLGGIIIIYVLAVIIISSEAKMIEMIENMGLLSKKINFSKPVEWHLTLTLPLGSVFHHTFFFFSMILIDKRSDKCDPGTLSCKCSSLPRSWRHSTGSWPPWTTSLQFHPYQKQVSSTNYINST